MNKCTFKAIVDTLFGLTQYIAGNNYMLDILIFLINCLLGICLILLFQALIPLSPR
jgi:hypothetical protein